MILTQERMILKGQAQWDAMVAFVRQAAQVGRPSDVVERSLWQSLLALGHTLLGSYVEGVGPGDVGDALVYEGRELPRLELPHDRRYVSVFGALTISRCVYGTRETQKHEVVPTDAWLSLPDSEFSYLLQAWDQSCCVEDSCEESRRKVGRILGMGQSVRSLEQMSVSMAEKVSAFRESQPRPPAEESGSCVTTSIWRPVFRSAAGWPRGRAENSGKLHSGRRVTP